MKILALFLSITLTLLTLESSVAATNPQPEQPQTERGDGRRD